MSDVVSFFVAGIPVPQGSKTIARRGEKTWLRDANAGRLRPWRHLVAAASDRGVTFDAPVLVELTFVLPKPKRPRWLVPAVKPDIDKLTRSTLDGMVDGGLLYDDARVVELIIRKRYPRVDEQTGVAITVTPW
ncbi:MAG: RusA family crossover junction endodeoxyribonuclease [Microbacterium sp.]|uniref:RusA family crossover junction endodeoxyribonuclease n=1 Tax=Microbacterium sp. TaxID=51671 RepID=UPI0025E9F3F3|nr:RusA family crossover junction endodeoxyribonuclease [Microbacterium sp.]MBQ9917401.1 RusA family crossover junction endodeoxyribonuclease [Microbacterium sp.]